MPERGIPRRISGGCAAGHILYKELNAERLLKCLKGSVRDIGVIMLIVILIIAFVPQVTMFLPNLVFR